MNQANRALNIQEEVEEARESLADAELLFANGRYQGATSRAYYAGFHMIQALLLTKGLEAKSHHGVAHLFRMHFVKTALLDSKYSQMLARAQKYREEADYHHAMEFTKEQTADTIAEMKDLIAAIEKHLKA
jgi:uncharacterized protein (UPF0332 family)